MYTAPADCCSLGLSNSGLQLARVWREGGRCSWNGLALYARTHPAKYPQQSTAAPSCVSVMMAIDAAVEHAVRVLC